MFFCEFCEISKNTFSYKTPSTPFLTYEQVLLLRFVLCNIQTNGNSRMPVYLIGLEWLTFHYINYQLILLKVMIYQLNYCILVHCCYHRDTGNIGVFRTCQISKIEHFEKIVNGFKPLSFRLRYLTGF